MISYGRKVAPSAGRSVRSSTTVSGEAWDRCCHTSSVESREANREGRRGVVTQRSLESER